MDKRPLNLSLDKETVERLKQLAKKNRRSLSAEVAILVQEQWEKLQKDSVEDEIAA